MVHTDGNQRKPNPRGAGGALREEIVQAAVRLVRGRDGLAGITLRSVAREARITAPSIYGHFGNLDAILDAVVDRAFDDLTATLETARAAHAAPVPRLRALCRAYASFAVAEPRLYALLFDRDQVPSLRAAESKSVDTMPGARAFAMLRDAVRACVAAGDSTSADPLRDAVLLWTALHGYVSLLRSAADFPWPSREDVLDQLADRLALVR
ncbi:TetR/AcrR family transcriptional regulator [Umezawaea sp.]|uniref:TetR/AcrR family transcriptional regulator n=1 Tax=Umezawaea sp. TaxID=1955258 RepID=UPI002ED1EC60